MFDLGSVAITGMIILVGDYGSPMIAPVLEAAAAHAGVVFLIPPSVLQVNSIFLRNTFCLLNDACEVFSASH